MHVPVLLSMFLSVLHPCVTSHFPIFWSHFLTAHHQALYSPIVTHALGVVFLTWQPVSEVKDHIIAMDMDMTLNTAFIVTHINNTWQISKQVIRDSPNNRRRRETQQKVWIVSLFA